MGLVFRTESLSDAVPSNLSAVYIFNVPSVGNIEPVGTGTVHLVGQTKQGPLDTPTKITSLGAFFDLFGGPGLTQLPGVGYGGFRAFRLGAWPEIYFTRVLDASAVLATLNLIETATPVVQIDATSKGLWGNQLQATYDNPTNTLTLDYVDGVFAYQAIYDGLDNTSEATFDATWGDTVTGPNSDPYFTFTFLAVNDPDTTAQTNLAAGTDGTIDATDYSATSRGIEAANNIVGIDVMTYDDLAGLDASARDTLNVLMRTHAITQNNKIVVVCGPSGQTVATAVTDVSDYRDKRMMYGFPWALGVHPDISAQNITESPAALYASVLANTDAQVSPATRDSRTFLTFVRELDATITIPGDYQSLKDAGIAALRIDDADGAVLSEHVSTSITSGEKLIFEERYRFKIGEEAGTFLAPLVNQPITPSWKKRVEGAFKKFLRQQISDEIIMNFEFDNTSENSPESESTGKHVIVLRIQMFPPATTILVKLDAGTGVLL